MTTFRFKRTLLLALVTIGFMLASTAQVSATTMNYQGGWLATTTYPAAAVVVLKNKTYYARAVNINVNPITAPNTTTYWQAIGTVGNTLVSGTLAPTLAVGNTGDFYINTANKRLYGPKISSGWPITYISMVGPGLSIGDMQYWNGSAWVRIPPPNPLPIAPEKAILSFCNGNPSWQATCHPSNNKYTVGKNGPAGGIVFYITDGGLHGLEVAPIDLGSSGAVWGCKGTSITGAYGTAVGEGAANTAAIVSGCIEPNIAAKLADNYTLNGYSDWFLPSKDELSLLYQKRFVVEGFDLWYYWSSSEINNLDSWSFYFPYVGSSSTDGKDSFLLVRPIRYF
jgi:hypothetical protein